jgi:hypothetical protein
MLLGGLPGLLMGNTPSQLLHQLPVFHRSEYGRRPPELAHNAVYLRPEPASAPAQNGAANHGSTRAVAARPSEQWCERPLGGQSERSCACSSARIG